MLVKLLKEPLPTVFLGYAFAQTTFWWGFSMPDTVGPPVQVLFAKNTQAQLVARGATEGGCFVSAEFASQSTPIFTVCQSSSLGREGDAHVNNCRLQTVVSESRVLFF